jgi:hypothetical protein
VDGVPDAAGRATGGGVAGDVPLPSPKCALSECCRAAGCVPSGGDVEDAERKPGVVESSRRVVRSRALRRRSLARSRRRCATWRRFMASTMERQSMRRRHPDHPARSRIDGS